MKNYILIRRDGTEDCDAHPIDTPEDIEAAQRELWLAGPDRADVWTGTGEDAIRTSRTLSSGLRGGAVSRLRAVEIIAEEGGDYDSVGPISSLVLVDDGSIADDGFSEPADLSTESAFRAQVAGWLAARA